ncbi:MULTISPECIES: hypothetical protein [unclassified Pseudoalteromonas]|uniref:hypothetical protein n=1 Tax=unclassified Pseudoalteromonas TaxID=194690 RepID=UPI0006D68400|nr:MULTISPECIES: hypothetical protein [unclassified Pseudoalteromonas]KPZ53660.1 hypothetical protein AN393_02640 [Pseudoalteromonas sp. P1-25]KPZ55496.1 hypothetical protein AN391_02543 [Pseudoalteromonas sp. P1-13-1a]
MKIFSQLKALIAHTILLSFIFCANAQHTDLLELDGFRKAVNSADYLAKVKIIKVESFQEVDGSQRHVFTADVVTTYKGSTHKQISYEMFVERGEDVMCNSAPIYLALCKSLNGSYYWPGTGSEFKPTPVINAWINENRVSLKLARTPAGWCD